MSKQLSPTTESVGITLNSLCNLRELCASAVGLPTKPFTTETQSLPRMHRERHLLILPIDPLGAETGSHECSALCPLRSYRAQLFSNQLNFITFHPQPRTFEATHGGHSRFAPNIIARTHLDFYLHACAPTTNICPALRPAANCPGPGHASAIANSDTCAVAATNRPN
jgi:hypothetical protein